MAAKRTKKGSLGLVVRKLSCAVRIGSKNMSLYIPPAASLHLPVLPAHFLSIDTSTLCYEVRCSPSPPITVPPIMELYS